MQLTEIRRAFISLLLVGVAYSVYSVCVVPLVDRPRVDDETVARTEAPVGEMTSSTDRFVEELSTLGVFPDGSWELVENPKVLRLERTRILFREFEKLKDGSLHVHPCTLVLLADPLKPNEGGPTVMQAPEGAILAFEEPLDIASGSFAKPVGGRLVGPIHIFRAGGANADDLTIDTANVQISNQRIITLEPVKFRYGNVEGVGRELEITRADENSTIQSLGEDESDQLIEELGVIQLQSIERLSVRLEGDEVFSSLNSLSFSGQSNKTKLDKNKSPVPSNVEVSSKGPLRFDLKQMKVTIDDQVRISRQELGKPVDTVLASRLTMQFAKNKRQPPLPRVPTGSQPSGVRKQEPEIALTHLNAVGSPLIIDAKSEKMYLECGELDYDCLTKRIKLLGANPFASPAANKTAQIRARGETYQIAVPLIELVTHENRSQQEIIAHGAGQFVGTLDGKNQVNASWNRKLAIVPAGENVQHLRVEGQAVVQTPGAGSINAEAIHLWFEKREWQVGTRLDGQPVFESKSIPKKLVTHAAPGRFTQIDSPQFRGSLEQMEILFQRNPNPPPVRRDRFGRPTNAPAKDKKKASRYRIDGGSLTAWLDLDSQDVYRINVLGQSRITDEANAERPFLVEGTEIDLAFAGETPIAEISGRPAKLVSADLDAIGNKIKFDGSRNSIRIPGPGTLKVQATSALWKKQAEREERSQFASQGARQEPQRGLPEIRPQPIDIEWTQGLEFDGKMVTLIGGVRATGEDLSFSGQTVTVLLDRDIDLSNLNTKGPRPELRHVQARGQVESAWTDRDEQGNPASYQQLVARDLAIDFTTGDVLAEGPGYLSFTSKDNLLPEGLNVAKTEPKPRPAEKANAELSHLSLSFTKKLEANMQRREAHLLDNIQMWFGPVLDWRARVDPRNMDRSQLRKEDVWMSCFELFVLESPSAPAVAKRKPIELLARGEAYVEGQLYAAKGHQVKYAEEKGMLTFEGNDYLPAELWIRKKVGERNPSSGKFRQIRFWPNQQQRVEAVGVYGIEVSANDDKDPQGADRR